MSVAALQFYDLLLSHGMKDAAARALAEAAENELARNRQQAEIRQLYRVIIGLIVAILGVGASWVWVSLRIAGVL